MRQRGPIPNVPDLPQPTIADGYRYLWNGAKLKWSQYGGRALTVAGTVGLFATGAHACRKTYKIHDELEENGRKIREAKQLGKDGEGKLRHKLRVAKVAGKCVLKTSRRYAADIALGALSGYAVSRGWHAEHQNYQEAAAMVGVIMSDFMNYRGNVIAEHGREADRRYLTTKRSKEVSVDPEKGQTVAPATGNEDDVYILQLEESSLRIWYSKETTPLVWSSSHLLRKAHLSDITNRLTMDLIYGGSFTLNDVRREFYGRKGDIPNGGMFGRIWDPGNPEHPERGAIVNLHYEEDEDFMTGRTDSCWIIIDIDPEPLGTLLKEKKDREIEAGLR